MESTLTATFRSAHGLVLVKEVIEYSQNVVKFLATHKDGHVGMYLAKVEDLNIIK